MGDSPADPDLAFPAIDFHEGSRRLLGWFFRNKRETPWREEHDPYRVWISEVMLQQTRSETAAAYYRRWLERFPTVDTLARAAQDEVLKTWEGLGYYSRARNLHRSARRIVNDFGGIFPESEEGIRSLPGVGEYTAAAVLSIAFAKPLGVVDGNVLRVVSRLLADSGSPGKGRFPRGSGFAGRVGRLKKKAREFVEASFLHFHPGWVNQAWMELGALVCLPKPRCAECPLSYTCRAYGQGRIEEFPPRRSAGSLPVHLESLFLLVPADGAARLRRGLETAYAGAERQRNQRGWGALLLRYNLPLLLVRRAEGGLLGGLWELPNYPARGEELGDGLRRLSIELLLDTGTEVRHRYSHFEIRFQMFVGALSRHRLLDSWLEQRWVLPTELADYPRPKVHIEAMHRFGLLSR